MNPRTFNLSASASKTAIVLLALSLGGCALGPSGYRIKLDSAPQSAMVDCEHEGQVGYTPVNIYVPLPPEAVAEGARVRIPSCNATWMSGAKGYYPNEIRLDPGKNSSVLHLSRPDAPDVKTDMEFDYRRKLDEMRLKQQKDELEAEKARIRLRERQLDELNRQREASSD